MIGRTEYTWCAAVWDTNRWTIFVMEGEHDPVSVMQTGAILPKNNVTGYPNLVRKLVPCDNRAFVSYIDALIDRHSIK